MEKRNTSDRRGFIKNLAVGAGAAVLTTQPLIGAVSASRENILTALGETIIPSRQGDPGFKDLEAHGIVEEVSRKLKALGDSTLQTFNQSSQPFFGGRAFVDLPEDDRIEFLKKVIAEVEFTDPQLRATVKRVYKLARITVLTVFYSNFPENEIQRDPNGIPVLKSGDTHQITTPNSQKLVTGWDIANYRGPLTWEQEEKMRAEVEKVHWHNDPEELIVRYRPKKA